VALRSARTQNYNKLLDALQEAIALVRKSVTDVPLQFKNFRD
jgi:uncharacterized protein YajQ (UPF0234 family)